MHQNSVRTSLLTAARRFCRRAGMVGILIAGTSAAASAQTTIAEWTLENDTIATNNNPVADKGTGTADSIGMNIYPTPNVGVTDDDVTKGAKGDTGANGLADTSNEWRVRGQAGSNGAANGWSSEAPIGTQGAQFASSTVGFTSINVQFDWYATTQGEANLQLEYTNNGTTWTNVQINIGSNATEGLASLFNNGSDPNTVTGYYISDNLLTNGSLAGQDWFQGLTATINDPLAANNPNFAIELVNASTGADDVSTAGTALNNTSGNWCFDRVSILGAAIATPEPSTGLLAVLGLIGMAVYGWRRRAA